MTAYQLNFIQVDRKKQRTDSTPELTYIYSFFAHSHKYLSYFKYIVRAEKYDDCFAIKYYCSRCKHSEFKYSRVLDLFSASETKRIMETCASVIPAVLRLHPEASFAFNGSRTHDKANYIENQARTQRYRIYTELVRRLFGERVFEILMFDDSSSCIFVNRHANQDIEFANRRIFNMFAEIFEIDV